MKCLLTTISLFVFCSVSVCADDAFERIVEPFFERHCNECHSADEAAGDFTLTRTGTDFQNDGDIQAWQRVYEQLILGQMPPADASQTPSVNQVDQVTDWIEANFAVAGITPDVEHKLRSPGFGNYVNHEKLFDGTQRGPASSPPRLWRLNPHVYHQFVDTVGRDLRRETAIHQPFALDETKGQLADFGAMHFADSASLQLLAMNCQTIAEYQTDGVLVRDHEGKMRRLKRTPPSFETIISGSESPSDEQLFDAINYEYQLLLERPPNSEERTKLLHFCRKAMKVAGNTRGLQATLNCVLMKPEAVYRMEIGLGEEDEFGRRRLSDHELAFALARAVSDKNPGEIQIRMEGLTIGSDGAKSQSLLQLATAGKLKTKAAIREVVLRFLDDNNMSTAEYRMFTEDHKVGNTRVLRFFREFFGYDHAPKVFKDENRIGHGDRFDREKIVNDADQLAMHIFDNDRDVLKRLLTTEEYFVAYLGSLEHIQKDMHYIKTNKDDANFDFNTAYVNRAEAAGRHPIPIEGPETRMYVGFYNLDHETWDYPTKQPFRMPHRRRAGVLMHPAWLIAWSGNFDNDPIRRGKWIQEHLLAGTISDVPLNVNAVVQEDRDRTLRDRLQVTRDEYCWQCHEKMDPLGLPFEQFDDFGRYREKEMVGDLLSIFPERHIDAETRPIDTQGEIRDSGETKLDGKVESALELVNKLANSKRVRQSFVRHAFRYWMGRNETLDDSPTLMEADEAYVKNGGSMKHMIASLLSSDSFLYRKTVQSKMEAKP